MQPATLLRRHPPPFSTIITLHYQPQRENGPPAAHRAAILPRQDLAINIITVIIISLLTITTGIMRTITMSRQQPRPHPTSCLLHSGFLRLRPGQARHHQHQHNLHSAVLHRLPTTVMHQHPRPTQHSQLQLPLNHPIQITYTHNMKTQA